MLIASLHPKRWVPWLEEYPIKIWFEIKYVDASKIMRLRVSNSMILIVGTPSVAGCRLYLKGG